MKNIEQAPKGTLAYRARANYRNHEFHDPRGEGRIHDFHESGYLHEMRQGAPYLQMRLRKHLVTGWIP